MTREEIEQLNDIEPYCFETDREEQWYKVGLQEGLKTADTYPKSSPWISVKDDLPCNNPNNIHFGFTNNILATDGKNIFIMHMKECKDGKWIWCSGSDSVDLSHPITHWMPIPKSPN